MNLYVKRIRSNQDLQHNCINNDFKCSICINEHIYAYTVTH